MINKKFLDALLTIKKFDSSLLNHYPSFEYDSDSLLNDKGMKILDDLQKKLLNSYPFFHPYYAGQMLKPPHPIAVIAYLSAMMINPNNHALDGGPATSELEKESVKEIAKMFGFKKYLGHLTSGGTVANLEGLWISKKINPKGKFAICENAHYTHSRLSNVLEFDYELIRMNDYAKMDLNFLESKLKKGNIGTVVLTLGTTGFGALDEISEVLDMRKKYGFRLHIDAAYGGFYKVLQNLKFESINKNPFKRLSDVDSIAIDPHKHFLQPYGCGCILFRDPEVGKFYKHDSPYTYFTSKDLHLGEITLECSRAGATAAALWSTLKLFPLDSKDGIYKILTKCRYAALVFYSSLKQHKKILPIMEPELDIVNYFYIGKNTKEISNKSTDVMNQLMRKKKSPIFLSLNKIDSKLILKKFPDIKIENAKTTVLRSVFMKPEHLNHIDEILNFL